MIACRSLEMASDSRTRADGLGRRTIHCGFDRRCGFTLVELLVVVAIIAILMALLVPAIQKVREAANVAQCKNNLKQIGIAMQNHLTQQKSFPTGGWGWNWTGVPSRGYGSAQPGGWVYNILEYIEQAQLHNPPGGTAFQASMTKVLQTPIPVMNCPSRRTGGPFANGINAPFYTADSNLSVISITPPTLARNCYAANCGTGTSSTGTATSNQIDGGPSSLDPSYYGPASIQAMYNTYNGICFRFSHIRMKEITRGSSNVIAVGEKYLNPQHYTDGGDGAENEGMYVGFDNDVYRTTADAPKQDNPKFADDGTLFGSCHGSGFNVVYCDGHVDTITYDIDLPTFTKLGTRLTDN